MEFIVVTALTAFVMAFLAFIINEFGRETREREACEAKGGTWIVYKSAPRVYRAICVKEVR